MENIDALKKACDGSVILALATSIDNVPNVRIVNYVWDENKPNIMYFTSDRDNNKVKEFAGNNKVAICSIPTDLGTVISLRSNHATVSKSDKTIKDVQGMFLEKLPAYGEALAHIGETLDVFELTLTDVLITLDFNHAVSVNF